MASRKSTKPGTTSAGNKRRKELQKLSENFGDVIDQVASYYPNGRIWLGTHYVSFDTIWQLGQIGSLPNALSRYNLIEPNDREVSTVLDAVKRVMAT